VKSVWVFSTCFAFSLTAAADPPTIQLTATSCEQDMGCSRPAVERGDIKELRASSQLLKAKKPKRYAPSNVLDDKEATAWCEGKSDDGVGEWISIGFKTEQVIDGLLITPFFGKSIKLAKSNNRITTLDLIVDSKNYRVNTAPLTYNMCGSDDCAELNTSQQIHFGEPTKAKNITVYIREIERGSKYRDTCISTVKVLRPDPNE